MSSFLKTPLGLLGSCAVACLAAPALVGAQTSPPSRPVIIETGPAGSGTSLSDLLQAPAAPAIVVTGSRIPVRIDQALAEVTVIERAQIAAAAGRTLAELLSQQAGVLAWSNGGRGAPASVSLRGGESRHTLLLIDGVRYGSATLGTPIWDNLPLDAIERIEIVRGPMSGLYGSDAVGGVVQIFTRGGTQGFKPDAAVMAGSHGTAEAAAGARFGGAGVDGSVRLQHLRNKGFSATNERVPFGQFNPDADGFRQTSAQLRLGTGFAGWRLEGLALASHGVSRYDDGLGADARADVRTALQSLSLSSPRQNSGWQSSLRLARSEDSNDVRVTASPFSALGATATVQRQISWENQWPTAWGTLLGIAERVQQDVSRPGAPYAVSRRTISAVALGLNGSQGPSSWQANVRHDRNSQFGNPTTGSLAYGLQVLPSVRATLSTGKTFVAPSFNQLYFPGFGNPGLQPEEGRQTEFSLRWGGEFASARLAWYEQRIRGYINAGPQGGNIPRTRIDGVSASADGQIGSWTLTGSFDSLNPITDSPGSANFGKLLPRRTTESARFSADWRSSAWTLGGGLSAHGPRFDNAANTLRMPGFATLDLRADWALAPDWQLGLKLNNALDQRYETTYGYNQPGREWFLSLRWAQR